MLTALAMAAAVPVDAALLDGLATTEATLSAHGQTHACSGPTLGSVLAKLGQPHGEALRGKALGRGVVVRARDGYAVLLSLGEIDASLGSAPAILATRCDGKPIDVEAGPVRLIMPSDSRPARSVRQVESLAILDVP